MIIEAVIKLAEVQLLNPIGKVCCLTRAEQLDKVICIIKLIEF